MLNKALKRSHWSRRKNEKGGPVGVFFFSLQSKLLRVSQRTKVYNGSRLLGCLREQSAERPSVAKWDAE
jgi:hypothetical protein